MGLKKPSLAIFISGQGSNLEIILQNKDKFSSLWVVSSNPQAFGLQRAKNHEVESFVLDKPIDWTSLQNKLEQKKVDGLFLAGFMKIVPASFVAAWNDRMFNLHPSLLPKYKGLKAIEKAYAAQDDVGVTIHRVAPAVDSGEILLQDVAVTGAEIGGLTLQDVTDRVHQKEHELVQTWVDQFVNKSL